MRRRLPQALLWALLIVIPDQVSKYLAQNKMALWESREIIPGFFSLTLVHNMGAAFGFLNSSDIDWQTPFFIGVTLLALGFILYLLKTEAKGPLMVSGLGLIMGGALGNLIDRVAHRYVIDFLDFSLGGWHWPAFNVADCGISVGAGLVILAYWIRQDHASDPD
ncbi:MAG: signal peptidase II [Desulfovibrionaceae bacterium]